MTQLLNMNVLRLINKYSGVDYFEHRKVLEELVLISFRNRNGFLPDSFDLNLVVSSGNTVTDVLNDLGYPQISCVRISTSNKVTYVKIR